jgi:acyl-CoA thioesterase-1
MIQRIKVAFTLVIFILASCQNQPTNVDNKTAVENSPVKQPQALKTVLFFGDSLTAGYGLDDPADAFPNLIQGKIEKANLPYHVVNAGVSGETTAGGKSRIDWVLKQKIDVFVLELGANDGLRGIPVDQSKENLQAIINRVKAKYPEAKLVMLGMQIPPSMGAGYASSFKAMYPELATRNKMTLVPFLLDKVGGVADLNQSDGIHPNVAGARIVANTVWDVMKTIL